MAREHQRIAQPWGTLEELLLACAVNRHGTQSWDSVAVEVQNRTTTLSSLTSQHCIDKFNDLKRRFMPSNDTSASLVSMVDELRRIRVEELRREVQRRKEIRGRERAQFERRGRSGEGERDLSGTNVGKSAHGNESGDERDNRSFNESNSTSQQKAERTTMIDQNDAVNGEPDIKPKPANTNEKNPVHTGSDPEAERDWSHNGKLREVDDDENDKIPTDKKEPEIKTSQTTGGLGESNELGESVGESKREDKEKQNSDVQSSASLSLKRNNRRRKLITGGGNGVGVGSSSGEEPEGGDEVSPAMKRMPAVKSEPLVKLLGIIRSHRLGSVFERRLQSQESKRYKKLIKQHIDLQMIQCRLDGGAYSLCLQKFFRDLLLLFNNAITFFGKNSPENLAARDLLTIVRKEMTEKLCEAKPEPVTVKPIPVQQPISFSKPNKSCTIVVCGKGNSAKGISESATKKVDKKDREGENKTKANEKKIEGSFVRIEEKGTRKKMTKERSISCHRNSNNTKKNGEIKHQYGGNELSSHDALEMKVERKGSSTRKRQGAASFLKRIKQNSPSQVMENDVEDDSSEDESKDEKEKEEKGKRGRNRDGITERVTRSSRAREESGSAKRIGRPPKKQAKSTVESGGGIRKKRGRDNGDARVEVGVGGQGRGQGGDDDCCMM
ncbi:hypothetical protein GH714_039474 [Hevea brasiliensis]|uniref:Bromo domain-containing protein n=1 Tax=Hevea brasiliensis TaxID=3981 RepID=A0A6A6MYW8_HEVBR|nr:hypothetical protein GH714_039474 [Hevea brasiliensis]